MFFITLFIKLTCARSAGESCTEKLLLGDRVPEDAAAVK
jgi:hypothetical protein